MAQRFVDGPIDDLYVRGRRYTGSDESANDAMVEGEEDLDAEGHLSRAMKAGRLYGTGWQS